MEEIDTRLSWQTLAVVILVLAAIAATISSRAADEDLAPDDDLQTASWETSRSGVACITASPQCYTDVDDDPDGTPDGAWNYDPDNELVQDYHFPTPSSSPSATTDAQAFDIVVSKCKADGTRDAGGGDPTYTLTRICQPGAEVVESSVAVTALNQAGGGTWTLTGPGCDSDGADVTLRLQGSCNGGGPNKRCLCVEAVEWEVTHAGAGPSPQVLIID